MGWIVYWDIFLKLDGYKKLNWWKLSHVFAKFWYFITCGEEIVPADKITSFDIATLNTFPSFLNMTPVAVFVSGSIDILCTCEFAVVCKFFLSDTDLIYALAVYLLVCWLGNKRNHFVFLRCNQD